MKRLWVSITLMIMASGVVIYSLYTEVENYKKEVFGFENILSRLQYENQRLASNLFYYSSGTNQRLREIFYTGTIMNAVVPISEKKLVFRFDQSHCNLCYEEELRRLNTQNPYVPNDQLVILTSFNERHFRAMSKKFLNIFPSGNFINIESGYLNLKQEQFNQPYYFILESDSTTHSFFFPDKVLPDQTQAYLEAVKDLMHK